MKYKLKDKVSQKQTINKKKVQYGGSTYVEKPVKKGKILSDKEIEKLTDQIDNPDLIESFVKTKYPEVTIKYHTDENSLLKQNDGGSRAMYFNDNIYVNKDKLLNDVPAELAHAEQFRKISSLEGTMRDIKDVGKNVIKNKSLNLNKAYNQTYNQKGTLENEAHDKIESNVYSDLVDYLTDIDLGVEDRKFLNTKLGTIKRQYGGNGNAVLIEDEELYKDEFGNIKESNSFSHDDKYVISKGVMTPVSKGNGGEIVDDATQVLSASYEQVKSGDRESNSMEQKVAFTAKEANKLLQDNGFTWFNTKKKMSPSELVRTANEQTKKHFKLDADQNNDYSKNSVDANLAQIPDVDVFDLVFEKQQQSKGQGIKKQYGGNTNIPISENGLLEYENQPVIVPTNNTGLIDMSEIDYPVDAYDADTNEFLETMKQGENYKFEGVDNVLEIPKAQLGTDVEKNIPEQYLVRKGDWISKIANSYGISVADLIKANPELKDINKISPGQKINIPELTIKGNKTLPVDRSAEIEAITELPEEKSDVVLDEEIPILDVKAETVDKKQDVANKIADVVKGVNIGKIDKSVPTNALREMMRANRNISLPYRTEIPNRTFGYTEEDPSLYLDELDSQVTQAMQQINPNTSQGLAIQSELLNNVAKNKRNIINQVNSRNLQRRQQTDNQNVQMQNQFDMMQEQANSQYVDGVQQTIANYDRNRVQQADLLDQMEIGKTRLNNSLVLENMKYPNFQIDENGNVIRIGTDFKVPLNTTALETKKARYGLKVKK